MFFIAVAVSYPGLASKAIYSQLHILWPTLIAALACNVYITGLNQLQDIDIDRINKPWLPIPAGKLSVAQARTIIAISGMLALVAAGITNLVLFLLIGLIMMVGTAYSLPPLKFKRHHIAAAASILLVRGLLVNVGMLAHFSYSFTGKFSIPPDD